MQTIYNVLRLWIVTVGLVPVVIPVYGQIATDGTVGSAQSLIGPNYAIGAGLGTQRGANLFHSFSTFNLNTGESATFSGPNGLQNVISRVTGGTLSSIDGTLRSEISGANVWFINPAGVVFGANAKLDVPAAFHVSTADELRFADGAVFSASNPAVSTLSAEPVAAFGFVNAAPKRIEVNGSYLSVKEGQTLSLVGGDINLTNATIYAPAGRLNIASVGSAGEVALTETDVELRGFGALGTLTMERDLKAKRVKVDMGEPFGNVSLGDLDTSGVGGGAMFIRGGNWLNQGGWVFSDTYGVQVGQGIHVALTGAIQFDQGTWLTTDTLGSGNGGSVTMEIGTLTLLNGSEISASTWGQGGAGSVTVTARNLSVDGQGSDVFTGISSSNGPDSSGVGGGVNLAVGDTLTLLNGGEIRASTWGQGDAGSVVVTARNLLADGQSSEHFTGISSSAEKDSTGAGGNINLTVAETLTLLHSGVISADTKGQGNAGSVTVTARNLLVNGQGSEFFTGISSETESSKGAGGTVNLTVADTLTLLDGGGISVVSFAAYGDAGSVTVTARNVLVNDGHILGSNVLSTGDGGNINLTVTDTLTLLSGGEISVSSLLSQGDGGNITISARNLRVDGQGSESFTGISSEGEGSKGAGSNINLAVADTVALLNGGQISISCNLATGNTGNLTLTTPTLTISNGSGIYGISSTIFGGAGGNILINADHINLLDGSEISTSVSGNDATTGGNVEINSRTVVALDGSKITAQAKQGKGGNILVNTEALLYDAAGIDDVLNASSESTITGNQGSVTVNTAIDPARSIASVSRRLGDLRDANQDPCARRKGQKKSTLTQVGRGGLPADNRPEGMTVSLSGGDWTLPAEPAEPPPSVQEPLTLNADSDDCRL